MNSHSLRSAILAANLNTENKSFEVSDFFIPLSHLKALNLDAYVITGRSRVGKSFLASALLSNDLSSLLPNAPLSVMKVRQGFGESENDNLYPNSNVFVKFTGDYYDLWRAVILRWVAEQNEKKLPVFGWEETALWIASNPDIVEQIMRQQRNWKGMILFDGLERITNNWKQMDEIVRGLLRAAVWLKSDFASGLYAKIFLREEQASSQIFDFPNASKLLANSVNLTWTEHDLHSLLWHRLINAPGEHGAIMRQICPADQVGGTWQLAKDMRWPLAKDMRWKGVLLRDAFCRLAGPWMGDKRRRAVPHVWLFDRLTDANQHVSPNSFLAAIRQAAEDSNKEHPDHDYPLHYESLKVGMHKGILIRKKEIANAYPWVNEVMSALEGLCIPLLHEEILTRWEKAFPNGPQNICSSVLPARHVEHGWDDIIKDLQFLGVLDKGQRISMPDLYRVGFGLGRRGV